MLLRKEFSISGFSESGEVVVEEAIDSFAYSVNENYFCRTLGLKQFEMTSHTSALLSTYLGNALATVLDRKTGVFDIGADTLMYYKADVVNAKTYYPFGKPMLFYNNTDFSFAYAFNGMERDDETGLTDFGARLYKEDYGRWLSLDPLWHVYPSLTPYRGFLNNPVFYVDEKGNTEIRVYNKDGTINEKRNQIIPDGSLAVYKVVNKTFFGPPKYNRTLEYVGISLNFAENGVDVSKEAYVQYAAVARLKSFTYEEWKNDKLTNACNINFKTLIDNQTDYAIENWRQDANNNTFCNFTFYNTLFTITGIDAQSWNVSNGKHGYTANDLVKNIDKLKWNFNVDGKVQEVTLFKEATWQEAVKHAENGGFAVAVQSGNNHGHVTILSNDQDGVDERDKVKTNNVGVEKATGKNVSLEGVWSNDNSRKGVKFYIMDTRAQSTNGTDSAN